MNSLKSGIKFAFKQKLTISTWENHLTAKILTLTFLVRLSFQLGKFWKVRLEKGNVMPENELKFTLHEKVEYEI